MDANAVDAAIENGAGKTEPVITVSAAEFARLRESAAKVEVFEKSTRGFAINTEINAALAGRDDLSFGAASKIAKDIRDAFEAKADGEGWKIATREGKSVADHLAAYLSLPENRIFLRGTARPGAGANATGAAPTGADPFSGQPATLGEAMMQRALSGGAGVPPFLAKYR